MFKMLSLKKKNPLKKKKKNTKSKNKDLQVKKKRHKYLINYLEYNSRLHVIYCFGL
jgi:hypothetical protein